MNRDFTAFQEARDAADSKFKAQRRRAAECSPYRQEFLFKVTYCDLKQAYKRPKLGKTVVFCSFQPVYKKKGNP